MVLPSVGVSSSVMVGTILSVAAAASGSAIALVCSTPSRAGCERTVGTTPLALTVRSITSTQKSFPFHRVSAASMA